MSLKLKALHLFNTISIHIVVDCHQPWCGKCDAILPTFQRIFLDHDNATKRIIVATASLDILGKSIQAIIPPDAHINIEKHGCLPLFLIIRVSAIHLVIVDA